MLETALASEREAWLSRCDKLRVEFPAKVLTLKCIDATDDAIWDIECAIISERVAWKTQIEELIDENIELYHKLNEIRDLPDTKKE